MSDGEGKREESQTLTKAVREGDEVRLKIAGRDEVRMSTDEYETLLAELRRTKWLLVDKEELESDERVSEFGGQYVGKGKCHECGFEGYIVENDIGTTYCPKCRSTNVGWPVR